MSVHYSSRSVALHHGDCLEVMAGFPDDSVDSIVTDPPYGLGFMGKAWDELPPGEDWARECLRVLKPGGHLLAFGGTRTWHRLACAVEDAGFEVRDSIAWLYGSGFPKSLDVSKAIDKAAGAEREVVGLVPGMGRQNPEWNGTAQGRSANSFRPVYEATAPATPAAEQWQGWGTALKPAFEPVVVARKPLVGTVAGNVLTHGTGALNIDATRIGTDTSRADRYNGKPSAGSSEGYRLHKRVEAWTAPPGRWPANVVLDDTQAAALDEQSGVTSSIGKPRPRGDSRNNAVGGFKMGNDTRTDHGDKGGASRFYYVAKAPKSERPNVDGTAHPTVKPLTLMRWLVRLVTPPGGTVLEPFAGSGTTVEACLLEGFRCIAIEKTPEYLPLILARIERANTARLADEVTRTSNPDAAILEQLDLLTFDEGIA